MDILSSLVNVAKKQVDDLIQTMVDEEENVYQSDNSTRPPNLDPSVSHDTFSFIVKIVSDKQYARKLFLSYSKILDHEQKKKNNEQSDKFRMTKEQNLHAKSIIQAVPEFDKLRFELCPSVMQDDRFWKVYFNLIQDKHSLGAPKTIVAPNNNNKYYDENETSHDHDHVENDECYEQKDTSNFVVSSEGKEDTITQEDIHKGIKRERDDDDYNDNSQGGFSDDLAVVSKLFYDGAKKTLQYAEQLIEAVDDHASNKMAQKKADTSCSEKKRVRFIAPSQTSDSDHNDNDEEEDDDEEEACDTDGFSVSSVDDDKEWATIKQSPRNKDKKKINDVVVDGFQLI